MLEVGSILEGKVTGMTKFGAFISLPEGKSGLVHISEIANNYVAEVSDHLQMGQAVKVKVIGISEDSKINLSIKKAQENYAPRPAPRQSPPSRAASPAQASAPTANSIFEDKLKQFMQESDQKNSSNRLYSDKRGNKKRK